VTRAPVPAAMARAGQTALLWRLGLLLLLVVADLAPLSLRAGLLFAWGAAALAALVFALAAPTPAAEPASLAATSPSASPNETALSAAVSPAPALPAALKGGLASPLLLVLVGLIVYGGIAGPILWTGNLILAGTLAAPLVALSLAVLLPGHDTAVSARSWALAAGAGLWAVLGTVAILGLAGRAVGGISALVPLLVALGAWSAVRRAVRLQGLGGRWPDALGIGVGFAAIVVITSPGGSSQNLPAGVSQIFPGGVSQILLGFVAGLLLAEEADRLVPVPSETARLGTVRAELVSVHQQLVFAAPLILLALTFFPPAR
jgi:hypothetical protein